MSVGLDLDQIITDGIVRAASAAGDQIAASIVALTKKLFLRDRSKSS
jgi:hypothetical protein